MPLSAYRVGGGGIFRGVHAVPAACQMHKEEPGTTTHNTTNNRTPGSFILYL